MRHKDPALMESILRYVDRFYTEYERMPSVGEVAKALSVGKTTAYRYLISMDEQGMLRFQSGVLSTDFSDTVSETAPLATVFNESISCGPMEGIEATVSERVHLPASMFGSREMFVIRTHGDSMIEAGIEPGDMVVVERRQDAQPGDIVVALTEEGNTLKRLGYDRELQRYYLHPENSTMYDIEVDELQIQGVVSFIIRQAQNAETGRSMDPELMEAMEKAKARENREAGKTGKTGKTRENGKIGKTGKTGNPGKAGKTGKTRKDTKSAEAPDGTEAGAEGEWT